MKEKFLVLIKIKKKLFYFLFSIYMSATLYFTTGCSTENKPVYVPVAANHAIPFIPESPVYPFKLLTEKDKNKPDVVIKAYVTSLKMCLGQNKVMRKQLKTYK